MENDPYECARVAIGTYSANRSTDAAAEITRLIFDGSDNDRPIDAAQAFSWAVKIGLHFANKWAAADPTADIDAELQTWLTELTIGKILDGDAGDQTED